MRNSKFKIIGLTHLNIGFMKKLKHRETILNCRPTTEGKEF